MSFNLKFLLLFPLIFLISGSVSKGPILPKLAILQVSKHLKDLQYVAKLSIGENLAPVQLVVDLNNPFVWIDCESSSVFSSRRPIETQSLHCSMAKSSNPCFFRGGGVLDYKSKICTLQSENRISRISTSCELNEDSIGMEFWDGVNSVSFAKKDDFLLTCAPNLLLKGLVDETKGILGLGKSRISLPSQFSTTFGFFQRRFSLCLSSSNGAIFLGGNPFENDEISGSMMYTPLISKKSGLQEGSYYINLNSIKISGKKLSLNQKGLKLAKISTVVPYTTMQSKIYQTFVEAYVQAAISMNLTKVSPLAPFEVGFGSKGVGEKWVGTNVPIIDLVLQSEMVKWRIHGRNSMVAVSDDVMCLGFLDGGLSPVDSIVIGGYQLEDYLLEFNLGNSMLGFSQSLLSAQKQCSDFGKSALYRKIF